MSLRTMRTTGNPGFFESSDLRVLSGVLVGFEAQVSKDAVFAVDIGRAELFAIDRDNAIALLAGRFGDQLFEPCAQIVNARRGEIVILSTPLFAAVPRIRPSTTPGFCSTGMRARWLRPSAAPDRGTLPVSMPMAAAGTMPKFESAE